MKKTVFILLTLACSMTGVKAQQTFQPNTGDQEMDAVLSDVNSSANKNMKAFTDDVSSQFGVPKAEVEQAAKVMPPGDVFMAAQVASVTNKPLGEVTNTYKASKAKGKGWGEIAKDLGIKPGSPEFHKMKASMKAHGNKGKGNGGGKGKGKEKGKGNNSGSTGGNGNGHGNGGGKVKDQGNGSVGGNTNDRGNGSGSGNSNVDNGGKQTEKVKKK